MKKVMAFLSVALCSAAVFGLFRTAPLRAAASDDYEVSGGRTQFLFEDQAEADALELYTEFGTLPQIMEGKLYCWTLAEQKVFLKDKQYSDVDVSVDISTINEDGKFDAGIFVQADTGDNPSAIDGVAGWNVNVERNAGDKTFTLKLHEFADGRWLGAREEVSGLRFYEDEVCLRVVVRNGMLYAFVYNGETPVITHEIGVETGKVGLRCFYSPNMFDNFCVIGGETEYDSGKLETLIAVAKQKDLSVLTQDSANALSEALSAAELILTDVPSQYALDDAVAALESALYGVTIRHTFEELSELIGQAEKLQNPQNKKYTGNSWNSLVAVLDICRSLTAECGENEISYWYLRLSLRMDTLIEYEGGNEK